MRISGWLLATGLLSGAAFAQSSVDQNVNQDQDQSLNQDQNQNLNQDQYRIRRHAHRAGQDVRTGYEETKQGAADVGNQAANKTEQAGSSVSQGLREGSAAIAGQKSPLPMGELSSGKQVRSTLTTDPVGMVLGEGLNLDYQHSLGNKFAWDVGGRFARTNLGGAAATNFGVEGGVDYFLIGRHNEGLRIGPRLDVGVGGTSASTGSSTVGSFAAGAELGYNWIASNGLTAGAAAGVHEVLGGNPANIIPGASSTSSSFGPYGKINLGYSW